MRCPGQDMREWKPGDIFDVICPYCGYRNEFFKDEPRRKCKECMGMIRNPRTDLGCAEYCPYAGQCLGREINKE